MHRAFVVFLSVLHLNAVTGCVMLGRFDMPSLFKEGEIMIGGIFPVLNKEIGSISTFQQEPRGVNCAIYLILYFNLIAFRFDLQINQDSALLPNISLGYRIQNSCSSPTNTLRAALTLASTAEKMKNNSFCPPKISAVIAESFLQPAKALAALIRHFGWQWIGAIQSDNDYGRNGILAFTEEVKRFGVCVAFVGTVKRTYGLDKILKVVKMIKESTVKVIMAFTPEGDFSPLMREVLKQNITGIQWIASEAWITAPQPSTPEMYQAFGGSLGFVVQKMEIPNLKPFLTAINPYANPNAAFVKDFWEIMVGCRPVSPGMDTDTDTEASSKICNGNETLANSQDVFFDVTQLRVSYNVYKGVYAVARALHQLIFCKSDGESNMQPCLNISDIHPKQVTDQLQKVNFRNQFGDDVFFDENGDPPASYDLINWQLINGQVQHVTLGHFSSSVNGDHKLSIKEDEIVWRTGKMVPTALCSDICPVGTRKAQIKGKPTCCFDCIPCADGTIANTTGASDCTPCPQEYWSNERKNECVPKTIEFLTYHEPLGIAITVVSLLGALLSLATTVLFIHYRETPIIKASNTELSCFLLFSLFLCFLCPLTFIGRPTVLTCMLRHTAFGVTFAFCNSCVLGKTIVVVTAFKASVPGSKLAGKFGPAQQRIIVCSCTLIQILICVLWLKLNPPFPDMVFRYSNKKIVLECNPGSEAAFYSVLGYIGILAIICLALAFLARKLPDNFNEAKFITFSMLIFCAVWITFIPAYISSPGKFTVAVETFAILSSAFGLFVSIFAPKCYIILWKPEKNTKKHNQKLQSLPPVQPLLF
uniref:G-protein coupled receptors family 3 profile domain-containing protein n=1 Tax=Salarias fasciatus TaxID=181472 RepID=A0A672GAF9_SALFA